jgi:F0F1-type ATP synthase assembly protein I
MGRRDDLFLLEGSLAEVLTVAMGAIAAVIVFVHWGVRAGLSFSVGVGLSWLNYRWLKRGVASIGQVATAKAGVETPRATGGLIRFLARYVLVIGVAYAILAGFKLPAIALVAGFFSAVVGVILASLLQLLQTDQES